MAAVQTQRTVGSADTSLTKRSQALTASAPIISFIPKLPQNAIKPTLDMQIPPFPRMVALGRLIFMLNRKAIHEIMELFAVVMQIVLLAAPNIHFRECAAVFVKRICKVEIVVLCAVKLAGAFKLVTENALPFLNGTVASYVGNIKCTRKRRNAAKAFGARECNFHSTVTAHRKSRYKIVLSLI